MPRKEARIFTSIWQDADFVALPAEAQRMYFLLLSQPELSLCGHMTLAENRWTRLADGMTKDRVQADLKLLVDAQPRPFVLVDRDTDEVLIRSFIRRDHVLRGPKLIRPLQAAVRIVRSDLLRRTIRDELQAAQDDGSMHPLSADAVDVMIKLLSAQVNTLSIPYTENGDTPKEKEEGEDLTGTTDYPERAEIDLLCNYLADRVEVSSGTRPPIGVAWRDSCRLMIDKDGRTAEQIRRAIDWVQSSELWRPAITTMPKLRRQYESLQAAATGRKRPTFEEFWAAYPRKAAKPTAQDSWTRAVTEKHHDPGMIIAAARRYADDPRRKPDYTAYPATWLNQERYNDGEHEREEMSW